MPKYLFVTYLDRLRNFSNERVFQIIVVRGWESFKAAWNWQETNAELEQLENPVVEQQETAPRNAPVLLRKEYKGAK